MKTFIAAQIGLAPLAAFWLLLGFGFAGLGARRWPCRSLAMTAWRWRRREIYLIEIGALATFLVMAAIDLAAPSSSPARRCGCRSPGSALPRWSASR